MKKYLVFVLVVLPSYCYGLMNPYLFGITSSSSAFLEDTFDVDTDTVIASHTPDITGGTWATEANLSALSATDSVAVTSGTGRTYTFNSASPPSADYTVTGRGTVNATGTTDRFGVSLRHVATNDGYVCYVQGDGNLFLTEELDGDGTVKDSVAITSFSISTEYTIVFGAVSNILTCNVYDGATLRGTVDDDDSTYTAAGAAGFMLREADARLTYIKAE